MQLSRIFTPASLHIKYQRTHRIDLKVEVSSSHPTRAICKRQPPSNRHTIPPTYHSSSGYVPSNHPLLSSPSAMASQATKHAVNFITGNKNKLGEVKAILEPTISVQSQALDLVEVQGTLEEVTIAKCRAAAEQVRAVLLGYILIDRPSPSAQAFSLPAPSSCSSRLAKTPHLQTGYGTHWLTLSAGRRTRASGGHMPLLRCAQRAARAIHVRPLNLFSSIFSGREREKRGKGRGRGWGWPHHGKTPVTCSPGPLWAWIASIRPRARRNTLMTTTARSPPETQQMVPQRHRPRRPQQPPRRVRGQGRQSRLYVRLLPEPRARARAVPGDHAGESMANPRRAALKYPSLSPIRLVSM